MSHRSLPDHVRDQLRYVRVGAGKVDLGRFPDFFIAGPQRTGTTWLHANMRLHPEIFLSQPKELYFFSRLKSGHPKFRSADLDGYLRFFRERPATWIYRQTLCMLRHRQLYRPKIRGEATATYAALDRDVIAEIARLNGALKIVMTVRDPVDRAWSHAKKDLVRNLRRSLRDVRDEEFEAFFRQPYQLRCAQYAVNLENWAEFFPRENIFIGRFDDIVRRPEELLLDVLRFLGVSDDRRYVPGSIREAVNSTPESEVPQHHRRLLEELLGDEIRAWRRWFA